MHKSKILKVNIQQEYVSKLTTALPLCILLSDEKHLGWYHEHYIKIFSHLNYDNSFECDLLDALDYSVGGFWDTGIIRFNYVPVEIMEDVQSIHRVLKQHIEDNTYCVLFVDEYYIENLNKGNHYAHEILVFGYNDISRVYNTIAFQNKNFSDFTISFLELERGFKNVFNYIEERDGWSTRIMMQFRPVKHMKDYPFSLIKFINNLNDYLSSNYSEKIKYLSLFDEKEEAIPDSKIREGISIELDFLEYLELLHNEIKEKNESIILRYIAFHNLREHKKLMLNHLKYANAIYKIMNMGALIIKYEEVLLKSEIIRSIFIKVKINLAKNMYIEAAREVKRLNEKVHELFVLEKHVLELIIDECNNYIM